ncbi:anaerobic sulfatase maturase [Pseudomonas sp. RSB 5.4]|uniref:anaerobic sulfatase maturase n=1 Tax=Pseudomonas sp. RSB 5.4 TaxID=3127459 RepID=UPI0030D07B8C
MAATSEAQVRVPAFSFHAMAKPSGADCNLDCDYCFYLEKATLYREQRRHRMGQDVLETYVRNYIESHPAHSEVAFTWQGGEPTLMGLDFYREAVQLQARYGEGRKISNSFQTNGLLIDDEWSRFFVEHDFLIGLSLDGPADIHDEYRVTVGGHPSHALVLRALHLFKAHGVRFNILACVNRRSSQEPLRIYNYFRELGIEYIQFIPIVERAPDAADEAMGFTLHSPGGGVIMSASHQRAEQITRWSVLADDYGKFLNTIFDLWLAKDVGSVYVMNFEWALANYMGEPGAACHHQPTCGRGIVVEHNGDVYACDHYVYPEYHLGNIQHEILATMLQTPEQLKFGQDKLTSLPRQCRECKMLKGCWGGCPKHRFIKAEDGEAGLNYLCKGYYQFFAHTAPYLRTISGLIAQGRSPSEIVGATLMVTRLEND